MTNITPKGTNCCSAAYHAEKVAADMHTVYWLQGRDNCGSVERHLRQEAWENLEKLAALFGAELVEIEQEPEPLDAETVAAREAATEQAIIDAGRGHLVK